MAKKYCSFVIILLIGSNMCPNSVEASPAPVIDGEVMFDSSTLEEVDKERRVEMPASCAGQTFCFDKGDNYPDKKIEELFSDMRELTVEIPEERTSIGDRNGDTYDEPDCPSNSTESPIFYITDINDRVRVVVQSPKKFQQIYSVKWCLNEGQITKDTPHFLKNTTLKKYKIECVSTMMDFDFFVLSDNDPVTQKPKMEVARAKEGIPVCCRCRYDADD